MKRKIPHNVIEMNNERIEPVMKKLQEVCISDSVLSKSKRNGKGWHYADISREPGPHEERDQDKELELDPEK